MKERARDLRKSQTIPERKLWLALRERRFCGYKFRRQRVFGSYVADFVCLKKRLIIEVDGSQHLDNQEYDNIRTLYLNALGFRVLRFWNNQVMSELRDVLNTIYIALSNNPHPPFGHLLPHREKEYHCSSSSET